jgi:hypothetical protein
MLQSVSKYLFITLLASGCSYRQGEPQAGIWDAPIHLDILSNETLYPELTQKLRRQLIEAIKAEQGPKLGQKENGASPLGGKLLNVDKAVLEQDSFGHPTELQFTLSFSLTWKGKTGTVHNTDLRHSSGLFRPYDARLRPNDAGRALSEREALDEAIKDLAQVILLEIRRHTKS